MLSKSLCFIPGILCLSLLLLQPIHLAWGGVPQEISLQGYLAGSGGMELVDGSYQATFRLYDQPTGGTALWSETQTLNLVGGLYDVRLGEMVALSASLFGGEPRYLGITIAPDSSEMLPRLPITSSAFAFRAADSELLEGYDASEFSPVVHSHSWFSISSRPAGLDDGDQVGITTESDPTVPAAIKDGISWSELSGVPGGFADGVDDSGILAEDDPQVGSIIISQVPRWDGSALVGGTIVDNGNIGIGTIFPFKKLHVVGGAQFDGDNLFASGYTQFNVGGGSIAMNNSGGWPSMVGYSPNGHRREISLSNDVLALAVSSSSAAPSWYNGMIINESGEVGIGTNPTERLDVGGKVRSTGLQVNGSAAFALGGGSINMSTPGGWPGVILYSPNGHRREMAVKDNGLYIAVSPTSSAPDVTNGIWILENGRLQSKTLEITGGSDLSEKFDILNGSGKQIPAPGMIVSIDPDNSGSLMISDSAYDRRVAGIISGAGGVNTGMLMGQKETPADGGYAVALSGRVYCWVDADKGAIRAGDLLTTSDRPGHAMRVDDYGRAQGAIIGKAMSSLESGTGLVLALVTLQ